MRPIGRPRVLWRIAAVLAVGGTLLAACGTSSAGPTAMVQRYLAAWSEGDYAAMAALVSHPPADFVTFNRQVASDLGLTRATHDLGVGLHERVDWHGRVTSHLTLGGLGTLRVRSRLELTDASGSWKVLWSPRRSSPRSDRGLGLDDTCRGRPGLPSWAWAALSLTTSVPMVSVGIEGSRVTKRPALTAALTQIGIPAEPDPGRRARRRWPTRRGSCR